MMMIEYQDIRMEGEGRDGSVTTPFSRCLTNNGIFFSFGHLFFPLVHWVVGQVPFYRQESSRGINDPSEHHSNKPARLNPLQTSAVKRAKFFKPSP